MNACFQKDILQTTGLNSQFNGRPATRQIIQQENRFFHMQF